jgi:hypothetical protein
MCFRRPNYSTAPTAPLTTKNSPTGTFQQILFPQKLFRFASLLEQLKLNGKKA